MGENYNVDQVNVNRLKVNRINLVQSLNVNDEFLSDLIKQRLIYYEEAGKILQAKSKEERAKNLVDCLIQKKPGQIRKDWFVQFRNILSNHNYHDLVTFLDNTIIKKPKFVEKFSSLSTISKQNLGSNSKCIQIEPDSTISSAKSVKDENFDILFKNLPSDLAIPEGQFEVLRSSRDPNDLLQYDIEIDVFDFFKKLEVVYSMYKNKDEQIKDTCILDSNLCNNILNLSSSFMAIKYYKTLLGKFEIDMLKYFTDSLVEYFNQEKVIRLIYYDNLDELVYKLVWTLIRNERYELANECLEEYLNYLEFLDTYVSRIHIENNSVSKSSNSKSQLSFNSRDLVLSSRFYAISNLIIVKNHLFDFENALALYNKALDLLDICKINGQKVVTTILYYAIANTYLEFGDFDRACDHINKSLSTLCYEDDLLIDILGTASVCYSSKWMIDKAENLALLAIQSAKTIYGTNSSHFVRALLNYCQFSNEFIQDESSIRNAEFALSLAKRVYGCETIPLADAYKALSKAYSINKLFKDGTYYEYATKSCRIAIQHYALESPKLIPYQLSLVSALQWRSIYAEQIEIKKVNLNDAYNMCVQALKSCLQVYGENSFSSAKIYRLLGSLFYYMERDSDSEKIHKKSLDILEHIISTDNLHYLLAKSTLGVFYKMIGQLNEGIAVLLDVANSLKLDEIKHLVTYCRWMPSVFLNLSECYRLKKSDDLASYYQKQAENLKLIASHKSHQQHKHHDIINVEMHRLPPADLKKFLKDLFEN